MRNIVLAFYVFFGVLFGLVKPGDASEAITLKGD